MKYMIIMASAVATTLSSGATAEQVFNENIIVDGKLCAGGECSSSEPFGSEDLRLKSALPDILFLDTSSNADDWLLDINEGITNMFGIRNLTADSIPFSIAGGAPSGSLYIADDGKIGLGTTLPATDLHILSDFSARTRYETTSGGGQIWDVVGSPSGFYIKNETSGDLPFLIDDSAPDDAFAIDSRGYVGIGSLGGSPGAPFEIASTESFNFFRISAYGADRFSVDITYTGGPLGTGQLRYNIVDGDNQEMSLDADGNMVIDGTLTTAGPTCASGCDRVFEADYPLPSIEDHAAQMFAAGHLPSVGPTSPGQPLNLSERMGDMLNALEHAHIYIAQQNEQIAELQADKQTLIERLEQTEAQTAEDFAELKARLRVLEQ